MFVVDAIPLTKIPLVSPQILTYFSAQKVKRGALLNVPLGRRETRAIALKCSQAEQRKLEIRKGSFKLKKITNILCPTPLVSEEQLELCFWLHQYYLSPLGLVLKLFLPKSFLRRKKTFEIKEFSGPPIRNQKSEKPLLFWSEERMDFYLKEIRSVKKQKQVLILVPEIKDINEMVEKIKQESLGEISFLKSGLKSSELLMKWEKIRSGRTRIIVGTRLAVFAPFSNLGLIIIDQSGNSSFKSWDQAPKYDARTVAGKLGEIFKAKIILGPDFPSIEDFYKVKKQELAFKRIEKESGSLLNDVRIVDMREEIKKRNFSIFSEELQDFISRTIENGKQVILFINRRGMATSVFCRDCGYVVKCNDCDVAMVYHQQNQSPLRAETRFSVSTLANPQKQKEVLVCHHCGANKSPVAVCPQCGGWRIKYFGTGTQKVVEELRKIKPKEIDFKIARLDGDSTPLLKDQEKMLQDFLDEKYNILVGTQLIFKMPSNERQKSNVNLAGVILIDSLLNIPDYKSLERAFQVLQKLKKLAKILLVQTYAPELSFFGHLETADFRGFFEQELKNRKNFNYPPFSEIIRLTFSHQNAQKAERESKRLESQLRNHHWPKGSQVLGPVPALVSRVKKKYIKHIILKVSSKERGEIKSFLVKNLAGGWEAEINPLSLL